MFGFDANLFGNIKHKQHVEFVARILTQSEVSEEGNRICLEVMEICWTIQTSRRICKLINKAFTKQCFGWKIKCSGLMEICLDKNFKQNIKLGILGQSEVLRTANRNLFWGYKSHCVLKSDLLLKMLVKVNMNEEWYSRWHG